MNKTLRISFLTVLSMLFNMSFAQVTFDFDKDADCYKMFGLAGVSTSKTNDGDFTESKTSSPKDGITLTVNPATGSTPNRIWSGSPRLRLYSGSMSISSAGENITKIVFKLHSAPKSAKWTATATTGTLTPYVSGTSTEVTWTGSEKTVTLEVSKSNTQIREIDVYVAGAAVSVAKPVIVGREKFTDKTDVTITSSAGTTIYYSTDGTTPDENADQYSAPFSIATTTTVQAIAYDAEGNKSEVATATFTKVEPIPTTGQGTEESPWTVTDICALYAAGLLPSNGVVTGTIYKVDKFDTNRGQINYYINNPEGAATDTMQVYGGLGLNGEKFTAITDLQKGDVVTVSGDIIYYANGKVIEFNYGNKILKIEKNTSTAIKAVEAEADDNAPLYNLSGARVGADYKGIVVKKGKKYVKK